MLGEDALLKGWQRAANVPNLTQAKFCCRRSRQATQHLRQPALTERQAEKRHEPDRDGLDQKEHTPCRPPLAPNALTYLRSAGAIFYPMGSFYTSLLPNLLPRNVGRTVADAQCPKIFIPNTGYDAELHGLTVAGQAAAILRQLREDAPDAPTEALLQAVLVDSRNGRYEGGLNAEEQATLARMGVKLVDRPLVREQDPQRHVPELTAAALLELTGKGLAE